MASTQMNTETERVRYSCPSVSPNDVAHFSWEHPVPKNKFWSDLPYTLARNFLQACNADDLAYIRPLAESDSDKPRREKLQLLDRWVKKKLIQEEASAAPRSFYDVDYAGWERLMLASVSISKELGDSAREEDTLRLLVDRRKDRSNLSHLHNLAGMLVEKGDYAEAERLERKVEPWLISKLGRDSPQALGAKRIMILAMWKQGRSRHADAEKLLRELQSDLSALGDGQYAMYRDEELSAMKELMAQMD
ncbi:hypothetical protein F5Y18DRAFT_390090 [Xylariaceae sp. FL1019]|nr:hypothetical protein F5Y18DRAFT_390090 [Xylariaceae sp. FL1019]